MTNQLGEWMREGLNENEGNETDFYMRGCAMAMAIHLNHKYTASFFLSSFWNNNS